ncbi:uncharacterized protein LOC143199378 [Rhynchophorus ferrugineus]|uniref:uncharacterized protein LOC143199378 n=1 Tax=Rhynchophorus ferrugineus TaxID=354439 RepID=UPI003FCCDDEA
MAGIGTPGPGKSPKDIGKANLTSVQLEQLVQASNKDIPRYTKAIYRTSAYLYFLGGDFDGSNLLRFIGHIATRTDTLQLTLSTLRFGTSMKGMRSKQGRIRFDANEDVLVRVLKGQVEICRQNKYLDSVLLNHNMVDVTDQERRLLVDRAVESYLKGTMDEITVMNVVEAKDIFSRLRTLYNEQDVRITRLIAEKEQSHPKSEVSLKVKGSRSSTNAPGGKVTRKSKESVSNSEKKIGEENVSEKRMRISNSDLDYKAKKKSPSGTNSKQTASVKRRPSSTSVDKKDSRGSVKSSASSNIPIPQILPERKELWTQFTEQVTYETIVDEYKRNENSLRDQYKVYLDEISVLNKNKDAEGKCFRDLVAAQSFRKFNKPDEVDQDGLLKTSYAERSCQGYLDTARLELLKQQERVLLAQENFKAILDNRQQLAKKLNDEFDTYCLENASFPADTQLLEDELKSISVDVNLEQTERDFSCQFSEGIPKLPEREQMIKNLQGLMQIEIKNRKFNESQKIKKWKNISVNDKL